MVQCVDCRDLANVIEPSICDGDAALCQITLTTCFHYITYFSYFCVYECRYIVDVSAL